MFKSLERKFIKRADFFKKNTQSQSTIEESIRIILKQDTQLQSYGEHLVISYNLVTHTVVIQSPSKVVAYELQSKSQYIRELCIARGVEVRAVVIR